MGRKRARKKSIGFKANVETDQDLITWWEAIPAGERSEVLRDLVRLAISGEVRSGGKEHPSQLAQVQEDTAWIREAFLELPSYLEQLVSQVAAVAVVRPTNRPADNGAAEPADDVMVEPVAQVDQETLDRRRTRMSKAAW